MENSFIVMKRFFLLFLISIVCTKIISYAEVETKMIPVYGKDIKDGSYMVDVESSSSMFRIVKAKLSVIDGTMTMEMTLSGTGYLKLFTGTGKEAEEAEEENYIPYIEDKEGAYTYIIPVEALNKTFDCAAYSKRKETWYDRQLVVSASSLPEEAFQTPVKMQAEDGNYTMEVTLHGGSGRATIISPAHIHISEKTATAWIEWSSPNYDYMIVNGKQYDPINSKGNSVFEIPVIALDQEISVIANTTAMSQPHEITYTLTFHSATLLKEQKQNRAVLIAVFVIVIFFGYLFWHKRRRKNV